MTGTRTPLALTLALLAAAGFATSSSSRRSAGDAVDATSPVEPCRPAALRAPRPRAAAPDADPPVAPEAPPAHADLVGRIPPLVPLEDLPVGELVRIASMRCGRYGERDWTPPEAEAAAAELRRRGARIVPELFDAERDGGGAAAKAALVELGPQAVPFLVRIAGSGGDDDREGALRVLATLASREGDLGPYEGDVVAAAVAALGDGDRGDAAEEVLAGLARCVPDPSRAFSPQPDLAASRPRPAGSSRRAKIRVDGLMVRVVETGDDARTAAALRVLEDIGDDDEGAEARAALGAVSADVTRPPSVRAAAAWGLASAIYRTTEDADLPTLNAPPDVRLWALAFAAQCADPEPSVVRALRASSDAAAALFTAAADEPFDDDVAWEAVDALRTVRPECAPELMRLAARAASSATRAAACSALGDVLHEGRAGNGAFDVRDSLLAALGDGDENVRDAAAESLQQAEAAGLEVVAGLASALDLAAARAPALRRLSEMGPAAAAAAPRLRALALDQAAPVDDRAWALDVLARVARDEAVAVAATQIASPSADLRRAAARILVGADLAERRTTGSEGEPTEETCRIAEGLLDDADADVRLVGAEHLARAAERSGDASPELLRLVDDADPRLVVELSKALAHLDPATPGVCDATLACLASDDEHVRWYAAHASHAVLTACGARAVPFLLRMIESDDEGEAAAGVRGIGEIEGQARAAVPAVVDALFDRFGRLRPKVLEALGYFEDDDAADAVPVLAECFRRGMDASVDGELLEALGHLGWTPGAADVARLLDTVRWDAPPDECGSYDTFHLIARSGRSAAVARRLVDGARASSGWTCDAAIDCLGQVSAGEPDVVAFLVASLASTDRHDGGCCNPSWDVAAAAAGALGAIGPAAKDALPALEAARASENEWLRDRAAEAVAAIAGDGR